MINWLSHAVVTSLMTCLPLSFLVASLETSHSLLSWSQGNKHFTTSFYPQVPKNKDNFIFSPISLQVGLAMTAEIALRETQQEILEKMVLPKDSTIRLLGIQKLLEQFNNANENSVSQFSLANGAWLSREVSFPSYFPTFLTQFYQATLNTADFRSAPEETRQEINSWVENKTFHQIQNLIPTGAIDTQTQLVLVNTLYMRAPWEKSFQSDETYEDLFHGNGQTTQHVSYMRQTEKFGYLEDAKSILIEIPFQKTAFTHLSLCVVIPREEYSLSDIEETLTTRRLDHWLTATKKKLLNLSLPKFKISSTLDAKEVLQNLGLQRPFSPNEAEFDMQKGIVISHIVHQAVFEVDEWGGTGSAGTGITIGTTSCGELPQEVKVNRPFLIFVADKTSGVVLFAGRVMQP